MEKSTVLVVFGGKSVEHDVSIVTGQIVIEALNAAGKYNVVPFYISQEGKWYSHPELLKLKTFQDAGFNDFLKGLSSAKISTDDGMCLTESSKAKLLTRRTTNYKIDIVFPALHGTNGEDGSLMGLLRIAGVPFVGCDIEPSVIAMNKALAKTVLNDAGLPVVDYVYFTKHQWAQNRGELMQKIKSLGNDLFVKPANLGSSIGISRAKNKDELLNGVEVAFHYDSMIIVEKSISNLIEVTVPVMGNSNPKPGLVERALNNSELFNFDDKYLKKGKKTGGKGAYSELPAKISSDLIKSCESLAVETFIAIGGTGLARVDLLIDKVSKKVYVNEINTLPGSLYHHNWREAGVSSVELVNKLIELAYEHHHERDSVSYKFKSNILQQF